MTVRGRDGAHVGIEQSAGIGNNGRGIAAARTVRENADKIDVGEARHLPGVFEVSTGSLRLDQSWKEPS